MHAILNLGGVSMTVLEHVFDSTSINLWVLLKRLDITNSEKAKRMKMSTRSLYYYRYILDQIVYEGINKNGYKNVW
jgi:hypothetical protein